MSEVFVEQLNIKKRNAKKTKERILIVAKQEFAKKGFSGTRMENIAKQADVNKALLHYYYKSKEKLYLTLLNSFIKVEKVPYFDEILRS
jgi:TetR/AcrR family transcriptional regulator